MAAGTDKSKVRVAVVGDASQLEKELRKAEAQLGGFGTNAKKSGDILRSALFGGAVLYGAKKLVDAAGELQQSIGGTAAVFEDASGAVNEFTKNSADLVGMSENASRTITSRLGASLKGFGMSTEEAASQAINLTKTGADLAATLGGKTDDAVNALGSALRGEYDPLERFGIALKASEVNAKAVSMGLASSESDVTAYAKGQATLALITERSAFAQGQFGREADTAQGQAQRAQAKTEDAAASLGKSLLPVYSKIQETIGFVADGFSALPGPAQTAVIGFAGVIALGPSIVDSFKLAFKAVSSLVTAILDAGTKAVGTQGAIASLNTTTSATSAAAGAATFSMGPLIAVMIAGAAVYKVFSDNQAEAARESAKNDARVESFTDAISNNTKTLEDNIRSVIAQDFATQQSFKDLPTANFEKLADAVTGSSEELDELVRVADKSNDGGRTLLTTLEQLASGGNSLAAELKRASFELLETGQASGYSGDSLEGLVRDLDGLRDSLGEATAEQEFATQVVDNLGASFAGQADEVERATKAIQDNADKMREARDPYFKVYESVFAVEEAQKKYTEALNQYGPQAAETQEATKNLAEAGFEYFDSLSALAVAQGEGKASAAELERQFQLLVAAGIDPNSAAMVRLKDKILEVGGAAMYISGLQPKITIEVEVTEAQRKIRELLGLSETLKGSLSGVGVRFPAGKAGGGPVDSGTPYIVGEKGPELFVPSGYGRIMDAFSTSKALLGNAGGSMNGGGGGNVTINVSVAPTADKASIGQTIVEAISSYERRSGPGWRS